MESNITQTNSYNSVSANNYTQSQQTSAANKSGSRSSSESIDTSYIKILIAQLAAARTSLEASDYVIKLNIELSKLEVSNKTLTIRNKIKKVIQNGNKKVSQLKEEEKLESKRKIAELKKDNKSFSKLDNTIKEKKRKRISEENNNIPKLDNTDPINLDNISVSFGAGADFSAVSVSDVDVSV